MNTIKLLIIASSDMEGINNNTNLSSTVIGINMPCSKFIGKSKASNTIFSGKSPKCSKCKYTEIEHKFKYPIFPNNPEVKYDSGWNIKLPSAYSDLWMNKSILFNRVKEIYGDNINIEYQSLDPNYANNYEYISTINKINSKIQNTVKINGTIKYSEPYHYDCLLHQLNKHKDYKDTKYDMIVVISGGIGWLYKPDNFKLMDSLLNKSTQTPNVIAHMWDKPRVFLKSNDYDHLFEFVSPVNSLSNLKIDGINFEAKKIHDNVIDNYVTILKKGKYVEYNQMLFLLKN
jgi:hypothetical protein